MMRAAQRLFRIRKKNDASFDRMLEASVFCSGVLLVMQLSKDERTIPLECHRRSSWQNSLQSITSNSLLANITNCDMEYDDEQEQSFASGYTENERFRQNLEYHRHLLPDYLYRWDKEEPKDLSWPKRIPRKEDISALENDLKFCERSPSFRGNDSKACLDIKFRIGTYYVLREKDYDKRMRGYRLIKELAESGHADGMCFYGMILSQGMIMGIDSRPYEAVVWWRRCTDFQRHIVAMYELGVALYTGDGISENTSQAVKFFRHAAHLGHVGAAYMLGQCLLDGIGAERDRANALEWLVMAAELGHELARKRVIMVLQEDYTDLDRGETEHEEDLEWVNADNEEKAIQSNIERRFTIGGGAKNPQVLQRRKTKVAESRSGS